MQKPCDTVWTFLELFAPFHVQGYQALYDYPIGTKLYSKRRKPQEWTLEPPAESPLSFPDDVPRFWHKYQERPNRQILWAQSEIVDGVTQLTIRTRNYHRDFGITKEEDWQWSICNQLQVSPEKTTWYDVHHRKIVMKTETGRIFQASLVSIPDLTEYINVRRWNTILSRAIRRCKERSAFKRAAEPYFIPDLVQFINSFI